MLLLHLQHSICM